MLKKADTLDFTKIGEERSSFVRIARRSWSPNLCAVCFQLKTDCWNTGESDQNGERPTKEKVHE